MPRPASSNVVEHCRRCGGKFGVDIDPCDKHEKEVLKRRCVRGAVCSTCSRFSQGDDEYAELREDAFIDLLKDPKQKERYMERRAAWCAERRAGKRRQRQGASDFVFV